MILGTGLDIVDVNRVKPWLEDTGLLERYFSGDEVAYVRARGAGAAASLAVRFAAKEAFGKALGIGLDGFALKDIEVCRDEKGCPRLVLKGRAMTALEERGGGRIFLSLSHDASFGAAQVIIEEKE